MKVLYTSGGLLIIGHLDEAKAPAFSRIRAFREAGMNDASDLRKNFFEFDGVDNVAQVPYAKYLSHYSSS